MHRRIIRYERGLKCKFIVHIRNSNAKEATPLTMIIVPLTDLTDLESENFAVNCVPEFKVYNGNLAMKD